MATKILFLDIDGVLNCMNVPDKKPFHDERCYGLNPALVANLKRVVDSTGCKIVVSSSWRYFKDYKPFRKNCEWKKVLADMLGYDADSLFIGDTPTVFGTRGKQIVQWLSENCKKLHSPVKICVVDDEISDIVDEISKNVVVKTDYMHGLTESDADKIIDIFDNSDDCLTIQ